MSLFETGNFILHSGDKSAWKINCDVLTDEDWKTLALIINSKLTQPFGCVIGIPKGGLKLSMAMVTYATPGNNKVLFVDDVITTGKSLITMMSEPEDQAWAIFQRGPINDPRIHSLFKMEENY